MEKIVEGSLKIRRLTLEKLFLFLLKSGRVVAFVTFASVIAIAAFVLGSKIKENEDDKFMKHFHI
jgi:hypothetical protein